VTDRPSSHDTLFSRVDRLENCQRWRYEAKRRQVGFEEPRFFVGGAQLWRPYEPGYTCKLNSKSAGPAFNLTVFKLLTRPFCKPSISCVMSLLTPQAIVNSLRNAHNYLLLDTNRPTQRPKSINQSLTYPHHTQQNAHYITVPKSNTHV